MKNKFLLAGLLLTLFTTLSFSQVKPNILWITIEDTSPQFIGCYGNPDARTPVIDQLASEGVRFTNAFSTGTVCSPSRTAIITGAKTYVTGTGHHRSNYRLPDFMHGFPYYMQQAGYYTTNNSKTDYNVQNPAQFIKEAWNESSGSAGWWNRKPGQPFFAVFNYNDSHQSRTMTDAYPKYVKEVLDELPEGERIGENAFKMLPFYRDSPEMRKQFAWVYNALKLTDNKVEKLLERLENDKLRDSTIIFFYADHGEGIPRGKTNGINLGYRVPFVIWFPPMYKHLSPWGESGIVTDELISFEDLAPTLISLAGGKVPDYMHGRVLLGENRSQPVDHLVLSSDRSDNGIDMSRTITNGRYLYTRNYMPYMPEARYIRYMEIGDIKQIMRQDLKNGKLNTLQASLFAPRVPEVLYDLESDIWETKNLIDDPAYRQIRDDLRAKLTKHLTEARDVLFLPEYEIARISETTSPYEFRQDNARYPINKLLEAASLSGMRSGAIARQQIDMLKSTDKNIRYWSILGLRSQDKRTLTPHKTAILNAMADSYEPVAVLASAIGYEVFKSNEAAANLKKWGASANRELALMTINELLYLTNKEPFVEAVREIHAKLTQAPKGAQSQAYKVKAACMDFLGSLGLVPNNPDYSE
ncbi:MAG: sulfatase [Bacteroidetes bacterium]|nr:sulfatase [Bacteroidota bacterium]